MTDQIFDERAAAYVGAREALKAANQIKVQLRRDALTDPENQGYDEIELGDEYWSLIAEAGVLAQLAQTDAAVGYLAGNYLVDQQQRIQGNKRRRIREDVHAKIQANRERAEAVTTHDHAVDGAPFATGHRVIITAAGEHQHRTGRIVQNKLSAGEVPQYEVALDWRGLTEPKREWFSADDLDLAVD